MTAPAVSKIQPTTISQAWACREEGPQKIRNQRFRTRKLDSGTHISLRSSLVDRVRGGGGARGGIKRRAAANTVVLEGAWDRAQGPVRVNHRNSTAHYCAGRQRDREPALDGGAIGGQAC